ncbi:MBL fold metallo-hydrolase [Noviherbaspirillum autotrophicum]|uniref:MBL fold metallo-hydrolase n=1 Tax=Noviherbaspirillum autotrophicum TaxID=709839 RepID=UPI000694E02A|nr:MBL fold metallo-hydrolase [Noviherbaspirillum autotrophicum]
MKPHRAKPFLVFLLFGVLAGAVALAWTFSAATLQPAALQTVELPPATPPQGMSLSALPTGSMTSRAAFAYRGGRFGDEREFAMTAVLVRHPRGDLLFDTGFGRHLEQHLALQPALMRATANFSKGTPAADQLAAHGFDTGRLAGVVLTHAHWDHVSGLDSLPGVPVWVNAAERDFIAGGGDMTSVARSLDRLEFKLYRFTDRPYLGFAQSLDVWGDGSVVLVPAAGHTPGSMIAFITLPSGARYALLGDLVWQAEGIDLPAERPWISRALADVDASAVRENIARVAAIHRRFPQIRMLPAHDARAMGSLPVFPTAAQ